MDIFDHISQAAISVHQDQVMPFSFLPFSVLPSSPADLLRSFSSYSKLVASESQKPFNSFSSGTKSTLVPSVPNFPGSFTCCTNSISRSSTSTLQAGCLTPPRSKPSVKTTSPRPRQSKPSELCASAASRTSHGPSV